MSKNNTFKCAVCKGVFSKETPEEEALAELHQNFGDNVSLEECDVVCDNCYNKIMRENNPSLN